MLDTIEIVNVKLENIFKLLARIAQTEHIEHFVVYYFNVWGQIIIRIDWHLMWCLHSSLFLIDLFKINSQLIEFGNILMTL